MPVAYQVMGCANAHGAQNVDYACDRTMKTGTDCTSGPAS